MAARAPVDRQAMVMCSMTWASAVTARGYIGAAGAPLDGSGSVGEVGVTSPLGVPGVMGNADLPGTHAVVGPG